MIRKLLQTFAVVLVLAALGVAQRKDDTAWKNTGTFVAVVPSAAIRVCTNAATGTPCAPLASVCPTVSLTGCSTSLATFTADSNGNYHFYASPGLYQVQITDPSSGSTITQSDVNLPPSTAAALTFAGNITFSAAAYHLGAFGVGNSSPRGLAEFGMTASEPDLLSVNLSKGLNLTDNANIGLSMGVSTTGGNHAWIQARNNLGANNVAYPIAMNPLGGAVSYGGAASYGGAVTAPSVGINGDTPMTAAPRMAWSGFYSFGLPGSGLNFATFSPDKAITVTRVMAQILQPQAGCAANGSLVVQLSGGGSAIIVSTLNGNSSVDSGAVTQNYAAGSVIVMSYNAGGSGCTQVANNLNLTVEFKLQ